MFDSPMWLPGQTLQINRYINIYLFFGKINYEPPSKPKDDIYRVSGTIFTVIYISLGFEAPGVWILLLIVQHSPIKMSVIDPS